MRSMTKEHKMKLFREPISLGTQFIIWHVSFVEKLALTRIDLTKYTDS